ncbi:hypothetical protein BDN72DRAFT_847157 [Pluteus cervinus]|uniref:Uncharacterized protein n=1 Tax=Pluteus cervinus TaxID=181527 RepID=A0ACD3AEX2_9AGAR|nr:hypothetical protein BDN72DRAFT_847157 [Pluteus cervinus]
MFRRALDSFPRIRIFRAPSSTTHNTCLSPHLLHPAPELEDIELGTIDGISLPDDMFKGVSPRLRHVALSGCSLSWTKATFLQNLTTLAIHCPNSPVDIDTLVVILHRMPNLVSLDLRYLLEEEEGTESTSLGHVALPHLKDFRYQGSCFGQDHALITRLRFPRQAQVEFESELEVPMDNALPQILDAFLQARTDEPTLIRKMALWCQQNYEDWEATLQWAEDMTSWNSILIEGNSLIPRLAEDWILGFRIFSLSKLEVLRTNIEVASGALWSDIFGYLPKLKEVSLTGSSGGFFLQHLIDNHTSPSSPEPQSHLASTISVLSGLPVPTHPYAQNGWADMALPSLRKISLYETNYEHVQLHLLVPTLRDRKAHGAPLHYLLLDNFRGALVDELKQVVDKVDTGTRSRSRSRGEDDQAGDD